MHAVRKAGLGISGGGAGDGAGLACNRGAHYYGLLLQQPMARPAGWAPYMGGGVLLPTMPIHLPVHVVAMRAIGRDAEVGGPGLRIKCVSVCLCMPVYVCVDTLCPSHQCGPSSKASMLQLLQFSLHMAQPLVPAWRGWHKTARTHARTRHEGWLVFGAQAAAKRSGGGLGCVWPCLLACVCI